MPNHRKWQFVLLVAFEKRGGMKWVSPLRPHFLKALALLDLSDDTGMGFDRRESTPSATFRVIQTEVFVVARLFLPPLQD